MSLSQGPSPEPIRPGKILLSMKGLRDLPISPHLTIVDHSTAEEKCIFEDWQTEVLAYGKQYLLEIHMNGKQRPDQLAQIISVVRSGKFGVAEQKDLTLPNCFHKPRIQYGVARFP